MSILPFATGCAAFALRFDRNALLVALLWASDLSMKNPNAGEEIIHRSPQDTMEEVAALDLESAEMLTKIRGLL